MNPMYQNRFFQVVVIPAAVFQAVLVGPGYGSGREVMEFVSQYGPLNGLLSLAVTVLCFMLILTLTFELGRRFQLFDYRSLFKMLIGRYWFVYEMLLIMTLLLVLAVSASAGAEMLKTTFGLPYMIGVLMILTGIVLTNYYGRRVVEVTLACGVLAFMVVLLIYVVLVIMYQGSDIVSGLEQDQVSGGWGLNGFRFAVYNSCVIPAMLYVTRHFKTCSDSILSGVVAGLFGALPAILFHFTFVARFPEITQEPLPTYWMIGHLPTPYILQVFTIVLFIMIVQTGVGILQGVNERLDRVSLETRAVKLTNRTHGLVAGGIFILSAALSTFGVIALVAKGYTAMAWGFVFVYFVPLLTRGSYVLWTGGREGKTQSGKNIEACS